MEARTVSNNGSGLPGYAKLPAHQHHQAKTEEEKNEARNRILDSDDLVVG